MLADPLTVSEARIETSQGDTLWKCPNCGARLAEIIGERVVIRAPKVFLSVAVRAEPDLGCHRCGEISYLRAA